MMSLEVILLQEGYGYTDEQGYKANGTSTLVKGKLNILIDTGGPWDKDNILVKLKNNGVLPADIDVVVGTHGHSDHIGNLNLFPHAKQIVGFDINIGHMYLDNNFKEGQKYTLIENEIEVIPTPGHTHSDVSVIVYNVAGFGTIGICGDLFECENDDGVWQTASENPESQIKNRAIICSICDYIIPGHGSLFKVEK